MAIIRSAVVWGGYSGKTLTSIANNPTWSIIGHNLKTGAVLYIKSGTPPPVSGAAMQMNTPYYAINIGNNNILILCYDAALTNQVVPTAAGYALTVADAEWYGHLAEFAARYDTRIYDSLSSAVTARNAATNDTLQEVIELRSGSFFSVEATAINNSAQSFTVTSSVEGVKTPAFHNGTSKSGYYITNISYDIVSMPMGNVTLDGFEIITSSTVNSTAYGALMIPATAYNCLVENMYVSGGGTAKASGIVCASQWARVTHNIVASFDMSATNYCYGIYVTADVPGAIIDNNLVTKHAAGIGFSVPRTQSVRVFNNISVGNTKNWGNAPNGAKARMAGNIGDSTDAEVIVPQAGTANATYGGVASSRNYAPCRVLTTGTYPMVSGVAGVTQLQANVRYYARSNATPGTLSLSSTETGTTFTFTDAGTGVLKVSFIWLSDTTAPLLVATDFPATPANTFVDFASGNYQPVATGVQVDNAYTYPEVLNTDALGAFRPSYNNGGAEYMDCGPFEFDKGFGPHPVSAVLTINNLVIGSDITILEAGTETILVNVEDHTSTNYAHTYTLAVPVDGTTKLYQIVGHIVDAAAGRVEFAPTEIQADQLPNTYYYDIQMTDASGRKRTIELDQYIYTQDITK